MCKWLEHKLHLHGVLACLHSFATAKHSGAGAVTRGCTQAISNGIASSPARESGQTNQTGTHVVGSNSHMHQFVTRTRSTAHPESTSQRHVKGDNVGTLDIWLQTELPATQQSVLPYAMRGMKQSRTRIAKRWMWAMLWHLDCSIFYMKGRVSVLHCGVSLAQVLRGLLLPYRTGAWARQEHELQEHELLAAAERS